MGRYTFTEVVLSFEYKFGFDDRMIMEGHFGLVAFCVANGWNVLAMVVFNI